MVAKTTVEIDKMREDAEKKIAEILKPLAEAGVWVGNIQCIQWAKEKGDFHPMGDGCIGYSGGWAEYLATHEARVDVRITLHLQSKPGH